MRVTRRQLRRIIHESMPRSTGHRGVELTDGDVTEASISAAWPDKVYYNGISVFETFYSDAAMAAARAYVEDSGFDDGLEVYLGYSPAADIFVMGFDAFPERNPYTDEEGDMLGVLVQLTPAGRPVSLISSSPGGMYPAGRNHAKRKFPDIIEVRLD